MVFLRFLIVIVLTCVTLAGCAQPGPTLAQTTEMLAIKNAYAGGQYVQVIHRVETSTSLTYAPVAERVEALKLAAFSYCLSNYMNLCRDSFERILKLDPNFTLLRNEAGHPLWGPVFSKVKAQHTAAGQ